MAVKENWEELRIVDISKKFGISEDSPIILKHINLTVKRGEFFCLLGPSGCGKSTLLNIVAAFEKPTQGRVLLGDTPIRAPGTDRIMIFQDTSNALYPWLRAVENVEFGLKIKGIPPRERREKSIEYLDMVGLTNHMNKFPFELSGGMKQRVQLVRALVMDPSVLLMDEPFAALDAITKKRLQREVRKMWKATKKTILYVTHDIEEAILLGTRIAVMSAGPEAHIKEETKVEFKKERSLTNPEFMEFYRGIESLIEEEVKRK